MHLCMCPSTGRPQSELVWTDADERLQHVVFCGGQERPGNSAFMILCVKQNLFYIFYYVVFPLVACFLVQRTRLLRLLFPLHLL